MKKPNYFCSNVLGFKTFLISITFSIFFIGHVNAQCVDPSGTGDCDGDGIQNSIDLDDDNDGILDVEEQTILNCNDVNWPVFGDDQGPYSYNGSNISNPGVGDQFLYEGVYSGVDAIVTIVSSNDSDILDLDVPGSTTGYDNYFQPRINHATSTSFTEFRIDFVLPGTITPAPSNLFVMTVIDNDVDEFVTFKDGGSQELYQDDPTEQVPYTGNPANANGFTQGYTNAGGDYVSGVGTNHPQYHVAAVYALTSSVSFRFGSTSGHTSNHSIAVEPCIPLDYWEEELIIHIDIDTDGDGVPNRLDNDSDNDGCPDAIEGSGTHDYGDIDPVSTRLTAAINGAGIPGGTSQDVGTSRNNTVQSDICDLCNVDNPNFLDNDNDGVADACDDDDDNDGILDTVENNCPTNYVALGDTFTVADTGTNGGTASGSIPNLYPFGGVSAVFSYEVINAAQWRDGVNSISSTGGVDGAYINVQPNQTHFPTGSFYLSDASTIDVAVYKLTFTEPVYNLEFKWGGLDNLDRVDFTTNLNGVNVPVTVVNNTLNTGQYVITGQSVTSTASGANAPDNGVIVTTDGPITEIVFVAAKNNSATSNAAVTMQLYELKYCTHIDTDKDGIADSFDTDSDNDGCPDAIEGAGAIVPSQLSTLIGGSFSPGSSDNLGIVSDSNGSPMVSSAGFVQDTTTAVRDATDNVACTADLSLTKTVDTATPKVGGTVIYTFAVTNNGPLHATGVKVTDVLPTGVTYASTNTLPTGTTYTPGASNVWDIGTLETGTTTTLKISVTVDGTGLITNHAEITSTDQEDVDSTVNTGN